MCNRLLHRFELETEIENEYNSAHMGSRPSAQSVRNHNTQRHIYFQNKKHLIPEGVLKIYDIKSDTKYDTIYK